MVAENEKLILLLPPKTGTHSLRRVLLKHGMKFSVPQKRVPYPVYHLTLSEVCHVYGVPIDQLSGYRIIQVTRNPYDRLISAWQHQMEILRSRIGLDELLVRLEEHKTLLPGQPDKFYRAFYDDPLHKENSFKKGNWGGMRFYFDQAWWNDLQADVHYFKLEELKRDMSILSGYMGVFLPEMPHIKPNKSLRLDGFNYFTSEAQKQRVQQLYANDFTLLGYEF